MARYQLRAAVRAPGSVSAATYIRASSSSRPVSARSVARPPPAPSAPSSSRSGTSGARKASMRRAVGRLRRVAAPQRLLQRQRVRRRDDAQRAHPAGWREATIQASMPPQSWPTRSKRLHLHGVGQRDDVADEVLGGVVAHLGRAGAAAVAALVGRDGAVAGPPERPQLVAPGPRGLREAVQEQDLPALVRAAGPAGEGEAARLDLEPVDRPGCVHDDRWPRRLGGGAAHRRRASSGLSRSDLLGNGVDERPLGHVVVGDGGERGPAARHARRRGVVEEAPQVEGEPHVVDARRPAEEGGPLGGDERDAEQRRRARTRPRPASARARSAGPAGARSPSRARASPCWRPLRIGRAPPARPGGTWSTSRARAGAGPAGPGPPRRWARRWAASCAGD